MTARMNSWYVPEAAGSAYASPDRLDAYRNALKAYQTANPYTGPEYQMTGSLTPMQQEVSGGGSPENWDAWKQYDAYAANSDEAFKAQLPSSQRAEYEQLRNAQFNKGNATSQGAFAAALAAMGGLAAVQGLGAATAPAGLEGVAGGTPFIPGVDSAASALLPEVGGSGLAQVPAWALPGGASASELSAMGLGGAGASAPWAKAGMSVADWALKNPAQAASLLGGVGALTGGGGGGGASNANTPALAPRAMAPTDMGRANVYSPESFTPGAAPPPRPGHTMGPSSAVNTNDPSSALFGYGAMPTYYKPPGMADGGEVLEPNPDEYYPDGQDTQTDLHRPPFDGRLPSRDEGPMGWITRLMDGDKKTLNQALLGVGGLGLLAQLMSKRQPNPGFRSIQQMQSGMSPNSASGIPAGNLAAMSAYFASPASRYAPPPPMIGAVTTGRGRLGMAEGGQPFDSSTQSHVDYGEGGGQDDRVQANLSPGEYVFDADVVSALGDGSNAAGAQALDAMREAIRAHKRSAPPDRIPPRAKSPLEYLSEGR